MDNKHIYKHALETSFFRLITSNNTINKNTYEDKPTIDWVEEDGSVMTWFYDDVAMRDHDYNVVLKHRND